MEIAKSPTLATQTSAAAATPGRAASLDYMQVGIGAIGLALILLFCAMGRRGVLAWRRQRAEQELQAASRLQEAIEAALAVRIEAIQQQVNAAAPMVPNVPDTTPDPIPPDVISAPEATPSKATPEVEPEAEPPVLCEVISPPSDPRKSDPKYLAARRLLDALHQAERDVEPFLQMVSASHGSLDQEKQTAARHVLVSWHQAIQGSRNGLQEAFSRSNLLDELPSVAPPATLGEALARLYHHAAFFTAMLTVQNKSKSPVLTWSKQLPGAVMQLYWSAQTSAIAADIQVNPLPLLPESAPSGQAARPVAPQPDNGEYSSLLKLAMGGGHVAR